ncbi:MAG TPA: hypothetical protein VIQ56_14280, partial [Gaiella sp.]
MARYVVVLALIFGALALVGAGCGGGDDESSPPPATETSGGAEPTTGGGETTTGGGTTGDATNGEAVFASAGCGGC